MCGQGSPYPLTCTATLCQSSGALKTIFLHVEHTWLRSTGAFLRLNVQFWRSISTEMLKVSLHILAGMHLMIQFLGSVESAKTVVPAGRKDGRLAYDFLVDGLTLGIFCNNWACSGQNRHGRSRS